MPTNRNNQATGFVNYNDILGANQRTGRGLGDVISGGLQSQGEAVKSNLGKQQEEFNTKYGQAAQGWDVASDPAEQLVGSGTAQDWSAIANMAANPDFTEAGKKFRGYAYTGPEGLANTSGLQTQAYNASQLGRMTGSAGGQQQLLSQFVGGGRNYTPGFSAFDQALLSKYGQGQLRSSGRDLSNISTRTNEAINTAAQKAATEKNLIRNEQSDWGKKLAGILGQEDNTTGLLGQAGKQAKEFGEGAGKVKTLFSDLARPDNAQLEADIREGKFGDLNTLIGDLGKYGVEDNSLYYKGGSNYNADKIKELMGLYANTQLPQGGMYFQGDQGKAAENLANFLGQSDVARQINENKFDPNVFNPESQDPSSYNRLYNILKAGGSEQGLDEKALQNINAYNSLAKSFQPDLAGIGGQGFTSSESRGETYIPQLSGSAASQYLYSPTEQSSEYLNPGIAGSIVNGAWVPTYSSANYTETNPEMQGSTQLTPQQAQAWQAAHGQSPFVNPTTVVGQNMAFADLLRRLTTPRIQAVGQGGGQTIPQ